MEIVAVLGAGGTMGRPIASNLARAGHEVRAWNRTREKVEALAHGGIQVADTPEVAATGATVVLTMLSDSDAVLAAMAGPEGALAAAGPEAVWLQMSTIGIVGSERCSELAAERGIAFVDAPVIGTKAPAERGELVVLASGPEETRGRVEPLFDVLGKRTLWLGEAGGGTRLKLVVNSWIVALVEGLGETLALAEGIGVDPRGFLDAIGGGPLDLPYAQMKGKAMIERRFEPAFKLALAAKDARLVEEAAQRHALDLPLVATVRERMEQGVPEHGDDDLAATFLTSLGSVRAGGGR